MAPGGGMEPLLDAILEHVPPPAGDPAAPLALLVAMVERDAFLGPIATGRIAHGTARPGDSVRVLPHAGARARLQRAPPRLMASSGSRVRGVVPRRASRRARERAGVPRAVP